MPLNSPRLSCEISMTAPTKSFGTMTVALTYGSSMCSISVCGGSSAGLLTLIIVPSVL